jgi:hypothetical protein
LSERRHPILTVIFMFEAKRHPPGGRWRGRRVVLGDVFWDAVRLAMATAVTVMMSPLGYTGPTTWVSRTTT